MNNIFAAILLLLASSGQPWPDYGPEETHVSADGWHYGMGKSMCAARHEADGFRVQIGMSRYGDMHGGISIWSRDLPDLGEDLAPDIPERMFEDGSDYPSLRPEFTFEDFPGTATFIDDQIISFLLYNQKQGEYSFTHVNGHVAKLLEDGDILNIFAQGKLVHSVNVGNSPGMAEMFRQCAEGAVE